MKLETPTRVPLITDPMARYWKQPPAGMVLLDGVHALMPREAFEFLQDCTGKAPTPSYVGQMWRGQFKGKWWLMWYEQELLDDSRLTTNFREILTVE